MTLTEGWSKQAGGLSVGSAVQKILLRFARPSGHLMSGGIMPHMLLVYLGILYCAGLEADHPRRRPRVPSALPEAVSANG